MINKTVVQDMYVFFKNNLYTLDLLLNKEIDEPIYFAFFNNAFLNYNNILIYFYEEYIQINILNLNNEIINNLQNLKYFSYLNNIEPTKLIIYSNKIEINYIGYKDINKLKELILETYKYL